MHFNMAIKKPDETFFVSNISDRNVSLTDLGLSIPARKIVNLLDKKHYYLTKEQLLKSAESGSLFLKRKILIVRKVPPLEIQQEIYPMSETIMPSRARSAVVVEDIKYEELSVSDDEFAQENSDIAEQDHLGKWGK
jgi:hypothetical protein